MVRVVGVEKLVETLGTSLAKMFLDYQHICFICGDLWIYHEFCTICV